MCLRSIQTKASQPVGLHLVSSLRSKRFRGVFCTKKPILVFLDAREMGRERKNGGVGSPVVS